jgi:hypothetical protein
MTAIIDFAAIKRAREVAADRPRTELASRVNAMASSGASLQEIENTITADQATRLRERRARISLLARGG